MKRILIFGMTSNYGGIESFIMNYYRKIDRSKFQFDFLVYNMPPAYSDEICQLGGVIFQITGRKLNYKRHLNELNNFFRQHSQEYIAIWCNQCTLSDLGPIKMSKKYGVPMRIVHSHNSDCADGLITLWSHYWHRIYFQKYASDIWACSDVAGRFFADKFTVINNAIDAPEFVFNCKTREEVRKTLNIECNFVVGHIGRFHPQKNHKLLIEIFEHLHKREPESILILIGTGDDEIQIRNLVCEKKLESSVRFLGRRNDIAQLLMAMDVLLFPSLYEGFPVVLVEAQASGLPCVTSVEGVTSHIDITGLVEFVSLSDDVSTWSERTVGHIGYLRKNMLTEIQSKGFDLMTESAKLQLLFDKVSISNDN